MTRVTQGPRQLPRDATQQADVTPFQAGTLTNPPQAHETPFNRVRSRETMDRKRLPAMFVHRLNRIYRCQRRDLLDWRLGRHVHDLVAEDQDSLRQIQGRGLGNGGNHHEVITEIKLRRRQASILWTKENPNVRMLRR